MDTLAELWKMKPIGHMKSVFQFKNGTPRQPALCSHARGSVTIEKSVFNNPEHSLEGLEQYSHVWIIFLFSKNNNAHTKAKVKPPRLDGQRVGVFSTRSPYRPNAIGLTLAKVDKIEGATIHLTGIDILDGTPVLDIKPYILSYDFPPHPPFDLPVINSEGENHVKVCEEIGNSLPDASRVEPRKELTDCVGDNEFNLAAAVNKDGCFEVRENDENLQCLSSEKQLERSLIKESMCSKNSAKPNLCDVSPNTYLLEDCDMLSNTDNDKTKSVVKALRENCSRTDESGQKFQVCLNPGSTTLEGKDHSSREVTPTVLPEGSCCQITNAGWVTRTPISKLSVCFTSTALQQLQHFTRNATDSDFRIQYFASTDEVKLAIVEILQEDPRSVYRRKNCRDSLYFFAVDKVHVTCWFDENLAEIVRLRPVSQVPECQV